MPIFQQKYEKNTEKESREMASVPLCRDDAAYLALYAVVKGVSTTSVHRKAVKQWIAGQVNSVSLQTELVCRLQRHWYHNRKTYETFSHFIGECMDELAAANIPLSIIEGITNKLKEQ